MEDVLHAHDERVLHRKQNVLLQLYVLVLVIINDDIFPDALHGVEHAVVLVLDEEDLPEGALPDHLLYHEVLQLHLVCVPVK